LKRLELHGDNITHYHLLILSWLFWAQANSNTNKPKGGGRGGKKEEKKRDKKKSYKDQK